MASRSRIGDKCPVCNSEHKEELERFILAGVPGTELADQFCIPQGAIYAHKQYHMDISPAKVGEELKELTSKVPKAADSLLLYGLDHLTNAIDRVSALVTMTSNLRAVEALNNSLKTLLAYEQTLYERASQKEDNSTFTLEIVEVSARET